MTGTQEDDGAGTTRASTSASSMSRSSHKKGSAAPVRSSKDKILSSMSQYVDISGDQDENGRLQRSSDQTANSKTADVLRKKISKVHTMMQETEQGADKQDEESTKIMKRLTTKLNQYQTELERAIAQAELEDEAEEAGLPPPPASPESPRVSAKESSKCDRKTLLRKLKKCDTMMADIVKTEGEKAFQSTDFQKYLRKRNEYLDELSQSAGVKRNMPSRVRSKRLVAAKPLQVGGQLLSPQQKLKPKVRPTTKWRPMLKPQKSKKKKLGAVSARPLEELKSRYVPSQFEKDPVDKDLIRTELKRNFIFKKLPPSLIKVLTNAFEPAPAFQKGGVVIKQGDKGDYFYIIASGSVEYEKDGEIVGSDEKGASFGELALLYTCPRKATVRATSDELRLYRVDQTTFRYTLQNRSKWITLWQRAVKKVIAMNRLMEIEGTVDIEYSLGGGKDSGSESDDITESSAELTDDEDDFDIDKDLSAVLEKIVVKRDSRQSSIASQNSRVSMASFNRESVLGEGQFGEVWMVHSDLEEFQDETFALKIQSKQDMLRASNASMTISVIAAIERECRVLSMLCHPFIVELVHKFEDDDNIYMVMGIIKGVELWDVIHREESTDQWVSGIDEAHAKFYGLLIADTLRFMHQKNIVYRDLKPENVMIDHTGYPVIVDFGFAKVIPDDTTFTFCGTVNYTCPEIISNRGHGCPADNWALGVVIYEMVSGENPFYYEGIGELQLLNDITDADPEPLADSYSVEVRDLVTKLLVKDPAQRLGSVNHGYDIIKHRWFKGIDLSKARLKQIPAPWAPNV